MLPTQNDIDNLRQDAQWHQAYARTDWPVCVPADFLLALLDVYQQVGKLETDDELTLNDVQDLIRKNRKLEDRVEDLESEIRCLEHENEDLQNEIESQP